MIVQTLVIMHSVVLLASQLQRLKQLLVVCMIDDGFYLINVY